MCTNVAHTHNAHRMAAVAYRRSALWHRQNGFPEAQANARQTEVLQMRAVSPVNAWRRNVLFIPMACAPGSAGKLNSKRDPLNHNELVLAGPAATTGALLRRCIGCRVRDQLLLGSHPRGHHFTLSGEHRVRSDALRSDNRRSISCTLYNRKCGEQTQILQRRVLYRTCRPQKKTTNQRYQ